MPRFYYTGAIDRKRILAAELDQRFADLELHANTTKFDVESFRDDSVRYRHYKEPPMIFILAEEVGTSLFTGALNKANVWNWTDVVLAHVQSEPNAPNGQSVGNPVIHIHAEYRSHDWEAGAYEIGIGYSTDGGTTYTLWPHTEKFLGYTQAHVFPQWAAKTTHYHTGALANWWSNTMYAKRAVHSGTALLSQGGIDVTTVTHWALGIRVNSGLSNGNGTKDVHELDEGRLWLVSRDTT